MSALFPPWTNTLARVSLITLAALLGGALAGLLLYVRSPLFLETFEPIAQPVEFDHRHHVADDAIDCRYCHDGVERGPSAGIPPTSLCMNCHAQVWNRSPLLSLVRESFYTDRPIRWRRVHKVPDFVFFNHAIHVAKGVGCVSCHGRVDTMPAVEKVQPLTMGFCLDCHRDPGPRLRPREAVTQMDWRPPPGVDPRTMGRELVGRYQVHTRVSCTTCHR